MILSSLEFDVDWNIHVSGPPMLNIIIYKSVSEIIRIFYNIRYSNFTSYEGLIDYEKVKFLFSREFDLKK
jgi:hypothetical protein